MDDPVEHGVGQGRDPDDVVPAIELAADHPELMKQICKPLSKIPVGSLRTIADVLPKSLLATPDWLQHIRDLVAKMPPPPMGALTTVMSVAQLKDAAGLVPAKPLPCVGPPPRRFEVGPPPRRAPSSAGPIAAIVPEVANWLRKRQIEKGRETKKGLGSAARGVFPKLRDADFSAAFKEVYGYERGRPRLPKND